MFKGLIFFSTPHPSFIYMNAFSQLHSLILFSSLPSFFSIPSYSSVFISHFSILPLNYLPQSYLPSLLPPSSIKGIGVTHLHYEYVPWHRKMQLKVEAWLQNRTGSHVPYCQHTFLGPRCNAFCAVYRGL